jgi:hypothetical protein
MRLQISESVNSNDWDEKICSVGGTIFHSSIWAKYIVAGTPHVVPQFMSLISDDGEFLGAALGFEQGSRHKLIRYFNKFLWFDAIPVVRDHDEITLYEFLQLIDCHAHRSGYIELSIGSFASRDVSVEMERLGFSLTKRFEFELKLDCSEDELWEGMLYKRRKNIKKALRAGVTIHILPGEKGVRELRKLQVETSRRILKRGGPKIALCQTHEQDPVSVLIDSGFARIMCADIDRTVVSAGLFTFFNGLVYYNLSGHSQRAFQTQAPTLLLWESIKKHQNEGAKKFNLSGCKSSAINEESSEYGVYTYKKAFGAKLIRCSTGAKILRRNRHRALNLAKIVLRR